MHPSLISLLTFDCRGGSSGFAFLNPRLIDRIVWQVVTLEKRSWTPGPGGSRGIKLIRESFFVYLGLGPPSCQQIVTYFDDSDRALTVL